MENQSFNDQQNAPLSSESQQHHVADTVIPNNPVADAQDNDTNVVPTDPAVSSTSARSPVSPQTQGKIRRRRNAESIFPPLRLTVENQLKALTLYADLSEGKTRPVSASEVAARIQKSVQTVAGYIKFFTSLGLIVTVEKTSTYLPSDALCQYANLRGIDPERANEQLRPLVKTSWFGQATVSEIKVNGARTFNQLVAALALVAKVNPQEKEYGAQLQQLIEWAETTKLIRKNQDGIYSLASFNGETDTPKIEQLGAGRTVEQIPVNPPPSRESNKKGGKDAILEAVENTYRLSAIIELADEEQEELLHAIKVIKKYATHPAFNDGTMK